MTLFPIPHMELTLGPQTLTLVKAESAWRPGWGGSGLRQREERPTPAGLIEVSATEPNVRDVSALAAELRALRRDFQGADHKTEPVTLTLPDLCARAALLEFDSLPEKRVEREALFSSRLRQQCRLPSVPARLIYKIFHQKKTPGRINVNIRVLAVAILEPVLAQYEQACAEAGLTPTRIGTSSLQLFDLCRPAMHAASNQDDESFFLTLADDSFTFMAIRHRSPIMLRIRPWREAEPKGSMPAELVATMQFYAEVIPTLMGNGPRPLFIVETAQGLSRNSNLLVPAATAAALGVRVISIDREGLPMLQPGSTVEQAEALTPVSMSDEAHALTQ
jgi:hypothetical protein